MITKTGLNDVGMFLKKKIVIFFNTNWYLLSIADMRQREGLYAVMTKTGPNDASGVVWAIGTFFKNFLHLL